MKKLITLIFCLYLFSCDTHQLQKEYEENSATVIDGEKVYKKCVEGHWYYATFTYANHISLSPKLDDDGKPVKCIINLKETL